MMLPNRSPAFSAQLPSPVDGVDHPLLLWQGNVDGPGGGGRGGGGWPLPLVHPSKSPDGHSTASDKAFLVTPSWQVLELEPGVITPSEIRRAFGLSVKTGFEHPDGAGEARYKERVDKLFLAPWHKCGSWAIIGKCPSGHVFGKQIFCGTEQCATCGKHWSPAHQRKFSRWLPKAQQMKSMAYLVIEWPTASRDRLRSKEALSWAGKTIREVLSGKWEIRQLRAKGKRVGSSLQQKVKRSKFHKGLSRWHFFGSPDSKDDKWWVNDKANGSHGIEPMRWNPHANVLTPGAYLPPWKLESLKAELREALGEPQLIVHYGFSRHRGKMIHLLKYVTRATFLDETWDFEMSRKLIGFRNSQTWGKWDGEQVWGYDAGEDPDNAGGDFNACAVSSLESSLCPECGLPLDWKRPVDLRKIATDAIQEAIDRDVPLGKRWNVALDAVRNRKDKTEADLIDVAMLGLMGAKPLGGGYWRLPDRGPPGVKDG